MKPDIDLTGCLLVSSSEVKNSIFSNSVIMIVSHNYKSISGVILNKTVMPPPPYTKPSLLTLGCFLSNWYHGLSVYPSPLLNLPLYFGGPVPVHDTSSGLPLIGILHDVRCLSGDLPSCCVANGIYYTCMSPEKHLDKILSIENIPKIQVFAGGSAWSTDQFKEEMQQNCWYLESSDLLDIWKIARMTCKNALRYIVWKDRNLTDFLNIKMPLHTNTN